MNVRRPQSSEARSPGWSALATRSRLKPPNCCRYLKRTFSWEATGLQILLLQRSGRPIFSTWPGTPRRANSGQQWTTWTGVAGSLRLYRAGGRRAVFAGSCEEYDWNHNLLDEVTTPLRPRTLYGTAKDSLRRLLAAAATQEGISMAWGRIFFLHGPHEPGLRLVPSVVNALLAGEEAQCTDG
jgi:hypothetical protein